MPLPVGVVAGCYVLVSMHFDIGASQIIATAQLNNQTCVTNVTGIYQKTYPTSAGLVIPSSDDPSNWFSPTIGGVIGTVVSTGQ